MVSQALRSAATLRPGARGEQQACAYLAAHGFEIVERNFRCRSGEIDIVAREGNVTVFIEVKQRAGKTHGSGFDAVTLSKRQRIVRAARLFAMLRGLTDSALRFDVVVIEDDPLRGAVIRHSRSAFDVSGR